MALRGGPTRRVPGNALAGMLRDAERRARKPAPGRGRRREAESAQAPQPLPSRAPVAAIVTTCEEGRAVWVFPEPFTSPPVISAVPVDPEPVDDEHTVMAALEEVTAWRVVVRVWSTLPKRRSGVTVPAGEGVRVHLRALPATEASEAR